MIERSEVLELAWAHSHEGVTVAEVVTPGAAPVIMQVNRAMEALTGWPAPELVGRTSDVLHGPETDPAALARLRAAYCRGEAASADLRVLRRDGTHVWMSHRVVPLPGPDGQVRHVAGFLRDISHRVAREEALARLALVAESSRDGIVLLARDGTVLWSNAAAARLTGDGAGPAPGRPLAAAAGWEAARPALAAALQSGTAERTEFPGRGVGRGRVIALDLDPLPPRRPHGVALVAHLRDITRLREMHDSLRCERDRARTAEQRLVAAIEALPDGFALYDRADRLVLCNETYRSLYLESAPAIRTGATFREILEFGLARGQYPEAAGREEEWIEERLRVHRGGSLPVIQEVPGDRFLKILERRTQTGDTVGFRVDVTDLMRQQRQIAAYAAELKDANARIAQSHAELLAARAAAEHNALHDALTGLPNRRFLDLELAAAAGAPGPIALLHVDLDRFKQINDTLGHAAGDAVLVSVAATLRRSIRRGDLAARVGGDEFVVVCRQEIALPDLAALADRLIAELRRPVRFEQHLCRFGASIGIAVDPDGRIAPTDLLVRADIALYQAKNRGRNRREVFTDDLAAAIRRRKGMADQIVAALDRGEFVPHYQPQLGPEPGRLLGAEALARWHRPDGSVIGPPEFLPIVEDLGLVAALDASILEQTLADWRDWQAAGLAIPRISVNVSSRRLNDPDLVRSVARLDPPRGAVAFELLESIFLDAPEGTAAWNLDALREMGIGIELDDFGTGHASLVSLLRVRPDAIKIDRELIRPVGEDAEGRTLVASLVRIGRALGVRVIAEGVETAAQLALLRRLGCDGFQGNGIAPALPAAGFRAWLSAPLDRAI